ncbi:hypothetical protein V2I01_16670 [Micromonospora sp. BRA006-A]|nr:hypothetical protein [Micromonospora sp. BRA006-A]
MLTPIAYGLAVVLSLFIVLIGARFLLTPQAAAAGYGVPAARRGREIRRTSRSRAA